MDEERAKRLVVQLIDWARAKHEIEDYPMEQIITAMGAVASVLIDAREKVEQEETSMNRYYLTHADEAGERHQLSGAYEAETPEAAITQMLAEAGREDDGRWEAHVVTAESDIQ
jgi:hypothetical protein